MRKIYLFDIGLLVVAGTVAAVLTNEPGQSEKLPEGDIATETATIPKERTGMRETEGDTDSGLIYSEDGSGLEE